MTETWLSGLFEDSKENEAGFFFSLSLSLLLSLPSLCISLSWAAAVTDLCNVNMLLTQRGCLEVNCMLQSAQSFLIELLLCRIETEERRKSDNRGMFYENFSINGYACNCYQAPECFSKQERSKNGEVRRNTV